MRWADQCTPQTSSLVGWSREVQSRRSATNDQILTYQRRPSLPLLAKCGAVVFRGLPLHTPANVSDFLGHLLGPDPVSGASLGWTPLRLGGGGTERTDLIDGPSSAGQASAPVHVPVRRAGDTDHRTASR